MFLSFGPSFVLGFGCFDFKGGSWINLVQIDLGQVFVGFNVAVDNLLQVLGVYTSRSIDESRNIFMAGRSCPRKRYDLDRVG